MVVKADNITKEYIRATGAGNIFTAVATTDIELSSGELVVVTGRSGSGKTTLMNMLAGLLTPTEGRVYADGVDFYSMSDGELSEFRSEHFGYIPQGSGAVGSLSVIENILLPYSLYGDADEGREYAMQLMDEFDIADLADARPVQLSGGELRRMSIARAMVRHPEVIYADEPTGDLDDENTRVVFEKLKALTEQGTTVLLVTHEKEATDYADVVYHMDAGELSIR